MENLFDQVYKNGFVVNEEKPVYVNLDTNIKLMTNIDKAQNDYGDNPNKLYHINKGYGFQTSIPQLQYSKVKEANNLIERNEPKIKHKEVSEYEEMRRINLQIQNRLNERAQNQIDTSYAPQGLTANQVMALSSTKPKLQNEIQAIEEYARTHFLSSDETKKLKEELIKKNYQEWVNNIEAVKLSKEGNIPLKTAVKEVKKEESKEETKEEELDETTYNVLQSIMTMLAGTVSSENQPKETTTNEPPTVIQPQKDDDIYEDFTAPITAEGAPTPVRQPRVKSPLRPQPTGDERLVNPTNPTTITSAERIEDKDNYPLDYVNGEKPIVNLTAIPNNLNIFYMMNYYMTNHFLDAFGRGTTIKTLKAGRNFLSLFQENTEAGRQFIEKKIYDKNFNFSKYVQKMFETINLIYLREMKTQQPFFSINTFKKGNITGITLPESPLQKRVFLKVLLEFLSACRKAILQNIELLRMTVDDKNNISFSNIQQMKDLKKALMDKTVSFHMLQLSDANPAITPNPPTQQRRPPKQTNDEPKDKPTKKDKEDKSVSKQLFKQVDLLKRLDVVDAQIANLKKEIKRMDGKKTKSIENNEGRTYNKIDKEKHEKDEKKLIKYQKEKKELEEKLSKTVKTGNGVAGSGGGVMTGKDGSEVVVDDF